MIAPGRLARGAPLALALAAAGCLTASQESRVQTDLDAVRKQVFEMQRDTATIKTHIEAIETAMAKQETASPTRWADLQALLVNLSDEIRRLGERMDDNTTRLTALSRDLGAARDQYRALEARIASFQVSLGPGAQAQGALPAPPPAPGGSPYPPAPGGASAQAAGPAGMTPASPAAPAPGQGAAPVPSRTAPAPAPGSTGSGAPAQGAVATPMAASGADLTAGEAEQEETFRVAYSAYTRADYESAIAGFEDFVKRYPDSPLAGNAQYYAGECLFSQQRYQQAAEAFTLAITQHPESDRSAAAYLKKGLSLLALKQTAQGVVQLQHVIEAYPRSEEARIAADRLRQLGLRDR